MGDLCDPGVILARPRALVGRTQAPSFESSPAAVVQRAKSIPRVPTLTMAHIGPHSLRMHRESSLFWMPTLFRTWHT